MRNPVVRSILYISLILCAVWSLFPELNQTPNTGRAPASFEKKSEKINFNQKINNSYNEQEQLADSMNELYKEANGDSNDSQRVLNFVEVEMKWQKPGKVVDRENKKPAPENIPSRPEEQKEVKPRNPSNS